MTKVKRNIVFKQYAQRQTILLPPSLDELIGPQHLVRIVDAVIEGMDLSELINLYKGGGTSAYHPRMLIKVLLYAYCIKLYTGRRIAKAISQDIHFMWLSGMSRPDFRTINNFRSGRAKQVIEVLFKEMLEFLMENQYIKMENYFCDGSTFRANANKYKMIWKKNAERYKGKMETQCQDLFLKIDQLNDLENKEYGSKDLEEAGNSSDITQEVIEEQVQKLNNIIKTSTKNQIRKKADGLKKKIVKTNDRINKYNRQINTAGKRSGYNKTDEDASAMMMKNKVEVLPAYNVLAGSENQFITGLSVHQNTNDGNCFKDHFKHMSIQQPEIVKNIVGDSIFGTEQNYELLELEQIGNYLKFPLFHKEQKKKYKTNPFLKDNFSYDSITDTYTCPNQKQLILQATYIHTHKITGFKSLIKEYECNTCESCPFYSQCCKSEQGKNRLIKVNEKLEAFKQQARDNLKTEKGEKLRKRRGEEIESCFGDIKHNMGFSRFYLRGLQKVTTEITLVAMAHNIRKMQIILQKRVS